MAPAGGPPPRAARGSVPPTAGAHRRARGCRGDQPRPRPISVATAIRRSGPGSGAPPRLGQPARRGAPFFHKPVSHAAWDEVEAGDASTAARDGLWRGGDARPTGGWGGILAGRPRGLSQHADWACFLSLSPLPQGRPSAPVKISSRHTAKNEVPMAGPYRRAVALHRIAR